MSLAKITGNGADALSRSRKGMNFSECEVYITKGEIVDEVSDEMSVASLTSLISTSFDTLGTNAKDSPAWKNDPVTEEVDYGKKINGYKLTGTLICKDVNQDMIDLAEALEEEDITLLIVRKNFIAGDFAKAITGINLIAAQEGKGNSDTSPTLTLTYEKRVRKMSDKEIVVLIV